MAAKAKIQIPRGVHIGAYQIRKMYVDRVESGGTW